MARNVYRYELLSVHMNDTPSNFFGSNKQRLFLNLAKGRGVAENPRNRENNLLEKIL